MTLFVSSKQNQKAPTNFRLAERWAKLTWNPLFPISPFAYIPFSGVQPGWCLDGFGFVHIRGYINTSTPLTLDQLYTVFDLPSTITPNPIFGANQTFDVQLPQSPPGGPTWVVVSPGAPTVLSILGNGNSGSFALNITYTVF